MLSTHELPNMLQAMLFTHELPNMLHAVLPTHKSLGVPLRGAITGQQPP